MRRKQLQAKDLADVFFIAAAEQVMDERNLHNLGANRWDIGRIVGFPEKVVLAKARRLIDRGLIEGCGCGCRGDFLPTEKGRNLVKLGQDG